MCGVRVVCVLVCLCLCGVLKIFFTRVSSDIVCLVACKGPRCQDKYDQRYHDLSKRSAKQPCEKSETSVLDDVRNYKRKMKNIMNLETINREGKVLVIFLS